MQKETTNTSRQDTVNEELVDTLIDISVVAKRLAANLRKQNTGTGGDGKKITVIEKISFSKTDILKQDLSFGPVFLCISNRHTNSVQNCFFI